MGMDRKRCDLMSQEFMGDVDAIGEQAAHTMKELAMSRGDLLQHLVLQKLSSTPLFS